MMRREDAIDLLCAFMAGIYAAMALRILFDGRGPWAAVIFAGIGSALWRASMMPFPSARGAINPAPKNPWTKE